MLDPSSSEEDDDDRREVTPPRRGAGPAATTAAAAAAPAAAMTPGRRRAYADEPRSSSVGTGGAAGASFAPAISVDQRSMSTASRASYDDSGTDSVTASPYHPHRGAGPAPGGAAGLPPPPVSPSLSASSPGGDRVDAGIELAASGERDEEERRRCMQIYVFVIRCIAYPFNAKQPTDMVRRQAKVTRQQLHSIRERFQVAFTRPLGHVHSALASLQIQSFSEYRRGLEMEAKVPVWFSPPFLSPLPPPSLPLEV